MLKEKPNVILIVIDCGRADRFSCYGYRRNTTPNIDHLAEQGIIYKNAFSPGSWTLPAIASIYTGIFPSTHNCHEEHKILDRNYSTIAEILHNQKYDTVLFCPNIWVSNSTGLTRGFNTIYNFQYSMTKDIVNRAKDILNGRLDSKSYELNNTIKWHVRKNSKKPFFFYIHYGDVHMGYRIPKKFRSFLKDDVKFHFNLAKNINQNQAKFNYGIVDMNPEDFRILSDLYDCALSYQDFCIGELIDFFKENRLLNNTLLIITADHGDNLGEHGLLGHQFVLYDTLIKVPLIIWNKNICNNSSEEFVQTLDLFPTLLDFLGINNVNKNKKIEGISLFDEEKLKTRKYIISEKYKPDFSKITQKYDLKNEVLKKYDDRKVAIRTNEYKFIWSLNGNHELYNINIDPGEMNNLIRTNNHVVDEFLEKFKSRFKLLFNNVKHVKSPEFEHNMLKKLEGLGYL